MPKAPRQSTAQKPEARLPLFAEINNDATLEGVRKKPSRQKGAKRAEQRMPERVDALPARLSQKIFREAKAQLAALEAEDREEEDDEQRGRSASSSSSSSSKASVGAEGEGEFDSDDDNLTSFKDLSSSDDDDDDFGDLDVEEQLTLHASDAEALRLFMSREAPKRQTLHSVIMDKVRALEDEDRELGGGSAPKEVIDRFKKRMDPQLLQLYTDVGKLLHNYKAGPVPKAFKLLPRLDNWEDLLWLTEPQRWSPAAMYYATRVFASNLNARLAQRFYNLILYPCVRNDIAEHKKLHFHLYLALKKALYKPAAFFKGILLPLCEERNCTLREALIIGSVLVKRHIPALHSAAAIMRIAEMEYSGGNSIFIRYILDKKYSLPHLVIDKLVDHFAAFAREERTLPVLWHQAFLTFAQRYKTEITRGQKQELKAVLKAHPHAQITPLIRQELFSSLSREDHA